MPPSNYILEHEANETPCNVVHSVGGRDAIRTREDDPGDDGIVFADVRGYHSSTGRKKDLTGS